MLPTREEGAVRAVAGTVAPAHVPAVSTPKFRIAVAAAWPINADSQSGAAATQPFPVAGELAPTADTRISASAASARQEPAGKSAAKDTGKDMARVLGPVPVHVTVVVPPPAVTPDADGAPTGSIGGEPSRSADTEVPAVPLPSAKVPPVQIPATRAPATLPPTTAPLSAEAPPASTARKHVRLSYLRTLAQRNGVRADARSETRSEIRAARGSAQPQPAFSLRSWLQQLSARPRDTRG